MWKRNISRRIWWSVTMNSRFVYSTLIHNCTKNAKVHLTNHWQQMNGTLIKIWKGNIYHSYFYSVVKFHTVALVYDKQLQKNNNFPFITISNRLEWHNMWYKYNSIRHDSGSSCCVVKNRQIMSSITITDHRLKPKRRSCW